VLCIVLSTLLIGCARIAMTQEDQTALTKHYSLSQVDELDQLDLDVADPLASDADQFVPHNLDDVDWQERSFKGNTHYSFSGSGENRVIQGHTEGTASMLYKQHKIDVSRLPYLNWRWKISNIYHNPDERSRTGDDFPARLYVAVQTGALPWETKSINYVWSSNSAIGQHWDNPYTDKAKMVVLQSGAERSGQWTEQKRNVKEDFKKFFDIDIDQLSGIAVMIDGDNSGSTGTAWFSNIRFVEK